MLKDRERRAAVRHALLVEKISKREACRRFKPNFRTIQKILARETPVDDERAPSVTKITPFPPFIQEYLVEDKKLPPKQRHTAKRIDERLRDEHGHTHSYRAVCYTIEDLRASEKKLFIPLAHPRGEARFDDLPSRRSAPAHCVRVAA